MEGVIDRETLKSSYLFPAFPYDKSLLEEALLSQLVSDSNSDMKESDGGIDLTAMEGVIDRETLKSSYLFPGFFYDKSLLEEVLLSQLVSEFNSGKALAKLRKLTDVAHKVFGALSTADDKMAEQGGDIEFELDSIHKFLDLLWCSNSPWPVFFRGDGREVWFHDIMGKKYVMACILSVPDSCISSAWDVANLSNELYTQREDDFEFIIFLRVRTCGWQKFLNYEDFLKPFHRDCIFVPLSRGHSAAFPPEQVLVIDSMKEVLLHCPISVITDVGSAAFPFKKADVMGLRKVHFHLNHSSLDTLLGVEPSHKLFRIIPGSDPLQEWRCISEFQSKIVFLYTYRQGNCLALLCDTLKFFRKKGREFEIIAAYVPAREDPFPRRFLEVFSSLVAKVGLSWWVVPYDSSTYPRLMPLYCRHTQTDRLIVFDPKLDGGDPHGLEVLQLYGPSMFPFTKMSVVEHVEVELKQVTLKSLFERVTYLCKEDPEYMCETNSYVCETDSVLEGKDVLVYFDTNVTRPPSTALRQLASWYNSLGEKEKRSNKFEVVCVYMDTSKQDKFNIAPRRQFPKWLISSDDEKAYAKYVVDNFFLKLFLCKLSTVVAFGKDGKISSLCAHCLLSSSSCSGAATFPVKGDLRAEIFNILNDYCTEFCSRF